MPFIYSTIVRLRDTDAAGLIFFPRLLELAHDAYETFSDQAGFSLASRLEGSDPLLPIVHCDADYLRPLRLGMKLEIEIALAREGNTSFTLAYRFLGDDGAELARAHSVHVALDRESGRAVALPAEIREKLAGLRAG